MLAGRQYFTRAEQAYDRAVALIRSLDETFQSDAFRDDPGERYDSSVTLYQFDVILQAILLQMALSDGVFHRLERRLIDRITRYGDLLVYLRKATNGAVALSWEKIDGLSAETKRELARRLPDILERTCNSFVHPLAVADGMVDSVDFLEKLENELQEIALSLSNIDGVRREAERSADVEMLEHLLTRRWKQMKEASLAEAEG